MGPRIQKQGTLLRHVQPLTPLMEGPDPEAQDDRAKKENSWEVIRTWVRSQTNSSRTPFHHGGGSSIKRMHLRLFLGVLGCPLAPVPCHTDDPCHLFSIKDCPIDALSARYIIHQYLAASGCMKLQQKSMYATGSVKMVGCKTEYRSGRMDRNFRGKSSNGGREKGCFVLWQMSPGMWLVELVVAGYKVVAGCNGKIVWRHLPWLGMNAARGPQRPLRRIIQGLDPNSTASMFTEAQCLGEKRIGNDDCFVLKASVDQAAVAERSHGPAEVVRHALFGYFSQRSGLVTCIKDSHLTRVQTPSSDATYWVTTIETSIEDYREIDGMLVAHQGRSVATVFRFGEVSGQHSRTRMEEEWRIDDVVFNVPRLSIDCFIPPREILDVANLR